MGRSGKAKAAPKPRQSEGRAKVEETRKQRGRGHYKDRSPEEPQPGRLLLVVFAFLFGLRHLVVLSPRLYAAQGFAYLYTLRLFDLLHLVKRLWQRVVERVQQDALYLLLLECLRLHSRKLTRWFVALVLLHGNGQVLGTYLYLYVGYGEPLPVQLSVLGEFAARVLLDVPAG